LVDVIVVAVADRDESGRAKAQSTCGAAKGYADYHEMLAKEKPELVAIGPRWARALFVTAESFDAAYAERIGLVQYVAQTSDEMAELEENIAKLVFAAAPGAIADSKKLVRDVAGRPIDRELAHKTAKRIAARRAFNFFSLKSGGFGCRCRLGGGNHFSAAFIQIRRDGLRFAAIFRLITTFGAFSAFLAILAILRLIAALLILLMLHRGLVHGVQDAEVMLRMLEIPFRHHAIPAAGRIAPELEVFFEKLLRSAAQPQIRPVRVKNMVAVERLAAV
jgi:hypothetical protein